MSVQRFSRAHQIAFAALVAILAVSVDCMNVTEPEDPDEPSIGLAALAGMAITRGESADAFVTITRANFSGAVTLTAAGLPTGATVSFSTNPTTSATTRMTVSVAESAVPGTYSFTLRATASGVDAATLSVQLIVEDFEQGFSLEPVAGLTIPQGGSASRTVQITRIAGFAGEVTVTVTDVPAGVNATVDPVATTGNSVEVTIQVDGSATVGTYDLTVRGNAAGLPEDTETLQVEVTAAVAQQITLDFRVCELEQRPDWLAYRDGSGPWVGIEQTSWLYEFEVASATVAVAVRTQPAGGSQVLVFHAATAELAAAEVDALCDRYRTKEVTATVAGISPVEEGAYVSLGDASVAVAEDGPITILGVPDGNVDLVAYMWSLSVNERMIVLRDLDPADGADLGLLDFYGLNAFSPTFAMMTVQGGSGAGVQWFMEYATSPAPGTCYYAPMSNDVGGIFLEVAGAPVDRQEEGDFHVLTVTDGVLTVSETFEEIGDRTITFGQPLPAPTVTDITDGAAYRRARVELTLPNEYDAEATLSLVDGDRALSVIATPAWLAGLDVSISVPDLSGAAGWLDEWAPTSASPTSWIFTGYGWSGDDCTEGAREVKALETGTVG